MFSCFSVYTIRKRLILCLVSASSCHWCKSGLLTLVSDDWRHDADALPCIPFVKSEPFFLDKVPCCLQCFRLSWWYSVWRRSCLMTNRVTGVWIPQVANRVTMLFLKYYTFWIELDVNTELTVQMEWYINWQLSAYWMTNASIFLLFASRNL